MESDLPITDPEQDRFGIQPFANALAQSLLTNQTSSGTVIAINGPWGTGKSSAMNLIKRQLEMQQSGDLQTVVFNPWWVRGEEALVVAFLQHLNAAMSPSLGKKAKKLLPKIGSNLLKFGGAAASTAGGPVGAAAGSAMQAAGNLFGGEETVEQLHEDLSEALRHQKKRFVIFIDDIDRLSPDEALAVFRLVKSVGRLPNVTYVLAFDRELAEKAVQQRFPSEGSHYLEKIIQASFDLPQPLPADLRSQLYAKLMAIIGDSKGDETYLANILYDIVFPEIKTPRDLLRFINALSLTFPAIASEVNCADFVAIETYRIFKPRIYASVRDQQAIVCGAASNRREVSHEELDALLLQGVSNPRPYRVGLMRLFPRLAASWDRVISDNLSAWQRDKRVCVEELFQTYFRLSLPPGAVSNQELSEIIACSDNRERIVETFLQAATQPGHPPPKSKIASILDAMTAHAPQLKLSAIDNLLIALFSIADQIDLERDTAGPFNIGDNRLRLHWLIRAALFDRTSLAERSSILMRASEVAEIGWLLDFAASAWRNWHPTSGDQPELEDRCLVTEQDAGRLKQAARIGVEAASKTSAFEQHRHLPLLLFQWRNISDDDGSAVLSWTSTMLEKPDGVVRLCEAFTSETWSQSLGWGFLGDRVASRGRRANIEGLPKILDINLFRRRVQEIASSGETEDARKAQDFLDLWRHQEAHPE